MEFAPEKRELFLDINPEKAYSITLLGMTRSGKSSMLNHIMERYFNRKINILMTESPNADEFKKGAFKDKDVIKCPFYCPQLIKECYRINKGTDNKYPFMFIMDDLVGHRSDKQMKKLHTIYRNSNLSCCITGQTISILDTTSRANTNFVLLGKLGNDAEIENVIKAFLHSFFPSDMKMIDKIKKYKELTTGFHFIVLDNLKGDSYITKCKL
jgi:GTPase SAR1 family protein